ncbi:MAG: sensor domain-containing diguanylate cyclase [Gammaproteobacteria bacterium]|nr:sensor domain-containing diguanylate cyclase [Gammaproteobacteria bacterium]
MRSNIESYIMDGVISSETESMPAKWTYQFKKGINCEKGLYPYLLGGVLAALLVGAATELIVSLIATSQMERLRSETTERVATIRAQLEGEINSTLHLTRGLIAYVATHPEVDDHEFTQLSTEIFSVGRNIRNIGLAKDNIITHMYPLAGNEAALGMDYRKNPKQWPAVKKAMNLNGTVVAGPVNLIQGGSAFIARTPIYTRSGVSGLLHRHKPQFWGIASIVIDLQPLFQAAGISKTIDGMDFALRGKDGLGADGALIFGNKGLFDSESVLQSVTLPNGSWQIAALPHGGWAANIKSLWLPRLSGWAIALILGGMLAALLCTRAINRHLALYDHLTKLPNRRLAEDRLEQMIVRSHREQSTFTLFYIDLDGFKQINDRYGHKVGDNLLIEVAKRMQASMRSIDTIARIGGDEFVILADGVGEEKEIARIKQNIMRNLSGFVFIDGQKIELLASMGCATFPEDGGTMDELLKVGDNKMYNNKQRNSVQQVDFSKDSQG